jgi:cytochrome c biogenesis protein CcdA
MGLVLSVASAFWLGVLTSISPCPLASNVAAISYLTKEVDRPRRVLLSGIFYSFGRVITYVVLGVLIAGSLMTVPKVAFFLQTRMNQMLGPILLLAGVILLGWVRPGFTGVSASERTASRLKALGYAGALLLGLLFALSFCPVSAGLFFGSLIPLSLQQGAPVALPVAYGLGTGLPVLGFALTIAFGIKGLSHAYQQTTRIASWLRKLTGWVFVAVGLYYLFSHLLMPLVRRMA